MCANILGSCYGSTGPTSIDPRTGRPYGIDFPQVKYCKYTPLWVCISLCTVYVYVCVYLHRKLCTYCPSLQKHGLSSSALSIQYINNNMFLCVRIRMYDYIYSGYSPRYSASTHRDGAATYKRQESGLRSRWIHG